MMLRASVSTSCLPRAVTPSRVHTASANSSPIPTISASSLRNAYDEIRFSMARSLDNETWFAVVMVVLSDVSQRFTERSYALILLTPRRPPPVASRTWPLIQRASSDARKAMMSPTSSGRPTRPWLPWEAAQALAAGSANQEFISVSVNPGATALTLMWRSPRSQARVRVRVLTAPLVMGYMVAIGLAM